MLLFLGPGDLHTADTSNYTKEIEVKPATSDLYFNGTFYLDYSDLNFEPYLTELGVGRGLLPQTVGYARISYCYSQVVG